MLIVYRKRTHKFYDIIGLFVFRYTIVLHTFEV